MTKTTVTDNADSIALSTVDQHAAGDPTDGHCNDDKRWAETVIASLSSRSPEARNALAKALLDGQSSSTDPVGCASFFPIWTARLGAGGR